MVTPQSVNEWPSQTRVCGGYRAQARPICVEGENDEGCDERKLAGEAERLDGSRHADPGLG